MHMLSVEIAVKSRGTCGFCIASVFLGEQRKECEQTATSPSLSIKRLFRDLPCYCGGSLAKNKGSFNSLVLVIWGLQSSSIERTFKPL